MSLRSWLLIAPAAASLLILASLNPKAPSLTGLFDQVPIPTDGAEVHPLDAHRVELTWPHTPWRVVQERTHAALEAGGWSRVDHKDLPGGSTTSWSRSGQRLGLILAESKGETRAMLSLEPQPM